MHWCALFVSVCGSSFSASAAAGVFLRLLFLSFFFRSVASFSCTFFTSLNAANAILSQSALTSDVGSGAMTSFLSAGTNCRCFRSSHCLIRRIPSAFICLSLCFENCSRSVCLSATSLLSSCQSRSLGNWLAFALHSRSLPCAFRANSKMCHFLTPDMLLHCRDVTKSM